MTALLSFSSYPVINFPNKIFVYATFSDVVSCIGETVMEAVKIITKSGYLDLCYSVNQIFLRKAITNSRYAIIEKHIGFVCL